MKVYPDAGCAGLGRESGDAVRGEVQPEHRGVKPLHPGQGRGKAD